MVRIKKIANHAERQIISIYKRNSHRQAFSISAILLLFIMLAVLAPSVVIPVRAEGGVTIELHYNRPDGNYDGWDVWSWADGMDGSGYEFAETDGEMVATIPVTPGVTKIGFIVRQGGGSWTAKDVDKDQFIELPDVLRGTVRIYVESGVEGYTRVDGDDVVTGVLVMSAKYDNETEAVIVTTTGAVSGDPMEVFTVNGPDGAVAVTAAAESGTAQYALTVGKIDIYSSYTVTFDGTEYKINMPNIYSTKAFEDEYTYAGSDLGAAWTPEKTVFRVWAPTAGSVSVNLYQSGTAGTDDRIESIPMTADVNGTWVAEKEGDLNGVYYTYAVRLGDEIHEACDPYARTTGVNGRRAMVIDLDSTDPEGWETDANPNAGLTYNDAVIYEIHVRDLSMDESSGIQNAGKYLGFTETGTKTAGGAATGVDHMKELGVTHVHLLPVYDYGSVDETKLDEPQFNWGYDPVNFNVPEGSYSTDPYNGAVRVNEMKQMVQSLHLNGLSVVMDVVYNHVQSASDFCVNQIVPGYFTRISDTGVYSNGSGCGNDTASERSMVRKYIVDSVNYWADEYHIDGFRFDLVGLLDTNTINEIVETVHASHPDVIFYGEGWKMDTAMTKDLMLTATQTHSEFTPGFAFFSDNIRDALKGGVFDKNPGFVSGASGKETGLKQDFLGLPSWSKTPAQTVNYVSCHDNNTLIDRLTLSRPDASREDLVRMNNLAAAFYMTSQGIPFMQAGEEMLRSKPNADGTLNENSYNAPDEVNSLQWDTLDEPEYAAVFEYYKGLIAFRKAHAALRLTNAEDVQASVTAVEGMPKQTLAFEVKGGVNGETSDGIYLIFNASEEAQEVTLPAGNKWDVYINGEKAGTEPIETVSGTVTVEPISAMVLLKGEAESGADSDAAEEKSGSEASSAADSGAGSDGDSELTSGAGSDAASGDSSGAAAEAASAEAGKSGIGVAWLAVIVVLAVAVIGGIAAFGKRGKKEKK